MIEAHKLTKKFGDKVALDEVSLHISKGSVYGIVGPNGAGKTTLLKLIVGIYKQDIGMLRVLGDEVYENIIGKNKIAFIADELYFFPHYTVRDMADFYKKVYVSWDEERYEKIGQIMQIDERMQIGKMSKGMKKQVAFWLAISRRPRLMVLDEPVDGLDPLARQTIWNMLIQDIADYEMTIIISSHNLRELEDVCDTIGVMYDGRIILEKELDQFKSYVYKVQVAFSNDAVIDELLEDLEILNCDYTGSVYTLIVRGECEHTSAIIRSREPLIFDILPLSLEEVFIYEVREAGYDCKQVVL